MSNRQSRPTHSSPQSYNPYFQGSNRTDAPQATFVRTGPGKSVLSNPVSGQGSRYHSLQTQRPFTGQAYADSANSLWSSPSISSTQTQHQPHQGAPTQQPYSFNVTHQFLPSAPGQSQAQQLQPSQRIPNRQIYPNNVTPKAISSTLGSRQTQPHQFAQGTSTKSYQQPTASDATRPNTNFLSRSDVYIAVMGITGSGKSTFVSICSERDAPIGLDLESMTKTVQEYTFTLDNSTQVHLLDTPGFDDTVRDDFTVLGDVANYLDMTYRKGILLRGIIYLHKIDDNRVRGSGRINLDMFQQLCGPEFQQRVIILTTMWDKVKEEEGTRYETQLKTKYLGSMIKNGSQMSRFSQDWGRAPALNILSQLVQRQSNAPVQIQTELFNGLELKKTSAGQVLHQDLLKQEEYWIQKLYQCNKEHRAAIARKDKVHAHRMDIKSQEAWQNYRQSQKRLSKLEGDYNQLEDELAEAKTQRRQDGVRISKMEDDYNQLEDELAEAKTQRRQDGVRISKIEDENGQLRDDRDRYEEKFNNLFKEVRQAQKKWEYNARASAEEHKKSRLLEAKIRKLKKNRNGKIFDFLAEIVKMGWGVAFQKYV